MKKGKRAPRPEFPPELPEGRPMPHEANPGGVEGVDPGWPGGSSNLGEVLNPEPPDLPTTYSTKDLPPDAPRVEVVTAVVCDTCGELFESAALLNIHRRSVHRPQNYR
jgi:hypothetical protein